MGNMVMTGIDYALADLQVRGLFSFTDEERERALRSFKQSFPGLSFVLLSTCNRTELWVQAQGEQIPDLRLLLCKFLGLSPQHYFTYFTVRQDRQAAQYLFRLTCGMESQIFLEDQILTQVREALDVSRSLGVIDAPMDKLFLAAVTVAKEIKTQIKLNGDKRSVMDQVMKLIKTHQLAPGSECLVIGNGEMGRLAAQILLQEGYRVTMTVRQYHKGEVCIPRGCQVVAYENRMQCLPCMSVVISATKSPHHTLHDEHAKPWLSDGKNRLMFDLAVPRDISVRIGQLKGVTLYDVDSMGQAEVCMWQEDQRKLADRMMEQGLLEYEAWLTRRSMAPRIDQMASDTAQDLLWRLQRQIDQLDLDVQQRQRLKQELTQAAYKSVSSLLFGISGGREGY